MPYPIMRCIMQGIMKIDDQQVYYYSKYESNSVRIKKKLKHFTSNIIT